MALTEKCTPVVESQVREVASLLSKAAKNYQVYLPNNRIFLASLAEVRQVLEHYLEENEVLTLVVKEFELLYDNVPVYSNQDKHQSIAFRMYRDGVRLVSFHRGISDDDLMAFFEALTKCLECENLEEDFVTLLWEKDLQTITYYEVSDYEANYADRAEPADALDPEFRAPAAEMAEIEWTDVARDVEKMMPALDLTAGDLDEAKNLAFVVEDDLFLKRSWQVICSTFDADNSRQACLDLENAVIGFLDACVRVKQLGSAAEVLSDVTARYTAARDRDADAALARIVESRHSEGNMAVVRECLAGDRESEHEQCLAYLSQMSPASLPPVIKLLGNCTCKSARQVVVMSVASIGKSDPAEIGRCTDLDSEDESDAALDALAAIGTETALLCAMEFRDHASPKIRAEVASLACSLKNSTAFDVAHALTQDANPSVRRKALASLVELGGERCVKILLDLFTSKEFGALPRDRKTSMLLVIRRLPPAGQREVIETILKMRGWLRRNSLDDTKAAVVDILHLMHVDTVEYVADNLAQRLPRPVQKVIDQAFKRVRRDESAI